MITRDEQTSAKVRQNSDFERTIQGACNTPWKRHRTRERIEVFGLAQNALFLSLSAAPKRSHLCN